MKAFLTGATGFVGGAIAKRLLDEGIEVHALVLPGSTRRQAAHSRIIWHAGDITDPATLTGLFEGVQWVIHAAGMLGRAGVEEATYQAINAEGTRHVLAAVAAARAAGETSPDLRVLHISSAGVLGPLHSDDLGANVDETAPLAPSNPYERSKALAETYTHQFIDDGLPVIIARPEFIYGPGDVHVLGLFRAIQRGIYFYVGDGQNTCHPTYIGDIVDGVLLSLREGQPGQTYHITGPRPLTFEELATTIAAELGVAPPRIRVPVPLAYLGAAALEAVGSLTGMNVPLSRTGVAFFSENRRSTYEKAHQEMGYTPQVDLEEGIGHTIAWYRQQGLL